VATQAAVPPDKAGAASGVVLTVLVGLGGMAVAVAASLIETRSGSGFAAAIDDVIRVSGVIAVVGSIAVATLGRTRSTTPVPG
jgi:hypothetical protein